jgi:hypothetical protein
VLPLLVERAGLLCMALAQQARSAGENRVA